MKKIVHNIFIILNAREKKAFYFLALLDIVMSVLDITFLALLLLVVDHYTTLHQSNLHFIPYEWMNAHPLLLIAGFLAIFSAKNLAGYFISRAQYTFVYKVASRLSELHIANYLSGPFDGYVSINSAVHIRKISQQPIEFGHYVLRGFQQIISQAILILVTIIAVLLFHPVLFLLLFCILMPPVVIVSYIMKKRLGTVRRYTKATSSDTLRYLQESISSYPESNIYNRKEFFTRRYSSYQQKLNALLAEQQVIQNIPPRLLEVFAVFGLFVLILINSFNTGNQPVNVLVIGAFMAAAYKTIPGIVKILNAIGQVKNYEFTINDLLPTIIKEERVNTVTVNKINTIEFNNVAFSYKGCQILKGLSFRIGSGDFIGLAGLSGRGKTTAINLLLGFLKPEGGKVIINNEDAWQTGCRPYWERISYVKQQPFLIHDSIVRNIVLSENGHDVSKFTSALKISGLDHLVRSLPEGKHTPLTENGKNFSGGQRQRIALARALYRDFDVIILDEPFSELDEGAEKDLLVQLKGIAARGKMVVLVTHNKTALSYCNKIISLDEK